MGSNEVKLEEITKNYYVIYRQVAHVRNEDDIVFFGRQPYKVVSVLEDKEIAQAFCKKRNAQLGDIQYCVQEEEFKVIRAKPFMIFDEMRGF